MGKKFLIDTNILIEYIGNLLPDKAQDFISEIIDEDFNISVINKIEILGHETADYNVEDFINLANVYNLDENVVSKSIQVRKSNKIKLPDAIIAATALTHDLTLISRNIADFKSIPGLKLINPWQA